MVAVQVLISVVVVVVILSAVLLAFKQGWFRDDRGEHQALEKEELSARDRRDEYSVPLRRRMHAWPLPLRIAAISAVLLFCAFAFMSYQLVRGGASPGAYFTLETYIVAASVLGVLGGITVQRWSDGRVDWLTVLFETEDGGGVVRRIPFMPSETTVSGGSRIIQVCRQNRVLGLFWRFERVADRRELRGAGKLPGDRVEVEVPDHAIEHDAGVVVETSPEGDRVIEGPANPDKTFSSPNQLSYEKSQQMRRENTQIKIRNEAIEAENAELTRQMNRLYEKIEGREHMEREDFKKDVMELLGPLMNMGGPQAGGAPAMEDQQGPDAGAGQPGEAARTDGGAQR